MSRERCLEPPIHYGKRCSGGHSVLSAYQGLWPNVDADIGVDVKETLLESEDICTNSKGKTKNPTKQKSSLSIYLLFNSICVCVCVHVFMHLRVCGRCAKDSLCESVLSFCHVGSGDWGQVIRIGTKSLYLVTHPSSLILTVDKRTVRRKTSPNAISLDTGHMRSVLLNHEWTEHRNWAVGWDGEWIMTRDEAKQVAWAQILQGPDISSHLTLFRHYQKDFKNKNELIISPRRK